LPMEKWPQTRATKDCGCRLFQARLCKRPRVLPAVTESCVPWTPEEVAEKVAVITSHLSMADSRVELVN
jgi:hypothetical protein